MDTPKVDIPFHIYTESAVETLCGEKNDHHTLTKGYFYTIKNKLMWFYGRGSVPVKDHNPMDLSGIKVPMMDDDTMFIMVPGLREKFHMCMMCEDCMALLKLRQLDA